MFIPENLEDLRRIVEQRLEETSQLEFKRQLPEPGKNDDLARDLAAMANTEGGVIIYGIEQDSTGRARDLRPFAVSGAAERVTLVAQNALDEALALGGVRSIISEEQRDLGFLVVEVPRSDRAPHFHQGTAWGRTSKGNAPLTRRRIGELFARSPAFAEEFGLAVGRPGRVLAKHVAEPYQETDRDGRLKTRQRYYLVFENDGETDVLNADWNWVTADETEGMLPHVVENPFPLELLQRGVPVRVQVIHSMGEATNLKVRTRWRDKNGDEHEQTWPVTW
jgi:hypothetical protein